MTFPRLSDGAHARPARTLRFARPAQIGLVALVAAAVALTPASGALAAGGDHKPQTPNAAAKSNGKAEAAKPGSAGLGGRERWWGFGKALHGEHFVERADGTFADVVFQYGTITEISDTSVTLASKDGFTVSWALTPATKIWIRGHHKGQSQVPVVGDQAGLWGTGPASMPTALQFVVSTERRKTPPAQPSDPGTATSTSTAAPTEPGAATSSSTAPVDPGAGSSTSTAPVDPGAGTSTTAPAAPA